MVPNAVAHTPTSIWTVPGVLVWCYHRLNCNNFNLWCYARCFLVLDDRQMWLPRLLIGKQGSNVCQSRRVAHVTGIFVVGHCDPSWNSQKSELNATYSKSLRYEDIYISHFGRNDHTTAAFIGHFAPNLWSRTIFLVLCIIFQHGYKTTTQILQKRVEG